MAIIDGYLTHGELLKREREQEENARKERERQIEANRKRIIEADRRIFRERAQPLLDAATERDKEIGRGQIGLMGNVTERRLQANENKFADRQSFRAEVAPTIQGIANRQDEFSAGISGSRAHGTFTDLFNPTESQTLGALTSFARRTRGDPHPDAAVRRFASDQLNRPELTAENPDIEEPDRLAAVDFFTTLLTGSAGGAQPSNFPGIVGKIPGFRNPEELAATLGTAGLGSIAPKGKIAGLIGGSIGATGGGAVAGTIDPRLVPVGELVGGLAGGIGGAARFGGRAAPTTAQQAGEIADQARQAGRVGLAQQADELVADVTPIEKFTEILKQAPRASRKTAAARSEELGRRVGGVERQLATAGTPTQRLRGALGELRGELPRVDIDIPEGVFSEQELDGLLAQTLDFDFGPNRALQNVRASAAFQKLGLGELPADSDLALLEQVFGSDFVRAVKSRRSLGSKVWQETVDLLNLPRTVLASFDHSIPGRQNIKLLPRYPKEWLESSVLGFKAIFRKGVAEQVDDQLRRDPTPFTVEGRSVPFSQIKDRTRLFHAPLGEAATQSDLEESFISRWATRIPVIGKGVEASRRGALTSGNKIRSDVLKRLLTNAEASGQQMDWDTVTGFSNLITRATGRGTLGPASQFAPLLSGLQFAPRFRLSHPQWIANVTNSNPAVRSEAVKQVLAFYGSGAAILSLVKVSGLGDVELDPRSTDFGRIRLGNTTVDFWGGMQGQARALARIFGALTPGVGSRKLASGDVIETGVFDEAFGYFKTGLSPQAALVSDIAQGRNQFTGEPLRLGNLGTEAFQRLVPIAWQDIVDAVTEWGPEGFLFAPPALLGIGVQSYQRPTEQLRDAWNAKHSELGAWTGESAQLQIARNDPDLKGLVETIDRRRLQFGSAGATAREERSSFLGEEEKALALPEFAEGIRSEQSSPGSSVFAGSSYAGAYEDLIRTNVVAGKRDIFGVDLRDPEGSLQKDFDVWAKIAPQQFIENGKINWRSFFKDKDAALNELPQQLRDAIDSRLLTSDSEMETQYKEAKTLLEGIFDRPKYKGTTAEDEELLREFMNFVEQETDRANRGRLDGLAERAEVALFLGEKNDNEKLGRVAAAAFRGNLDLDIDRLNFVLENQDVLSIFFPNELRNFLPIQIERGQFVNDDVFRRITAR